ncbi:FtsL-like putative cell division protein [Cytophaga aurantiaca]|uniref:FtsL-like putative cell division protein n=1 Tax=Cytophaga aurantiaca TaxID=29530 RepID=UPI000362788D|nr:FtsL-like putative cell division protein [Cytophaga aurantiaca]
MAKNTVRSTPEPQVEEPIEQDVKPSGKGVFSMVDKYIPIGQIFNEGLPVQYVPKVLFFAFVMMMYIANAHYADKLVRKIAKMNSEVNDLRADYTTLKADLMFKSKQSEVAKQVENLGLKESTEPPIKITEKQREY